MRFTLLRPLAIVILASVPAVGAEINVPGLANPWLAGMPPGSTADGGDAAPAQSPAQVPDLALSAETAVSFTVTGGVGAHTARQPAPPDGGSNAEGLWILDHRAGAENGIATLRAPIESLLGVFIGSEQPSLSPSPAGLDFSTPASRDALVIRPQLKQVFFIGDGLASAGANQYFVVPSGATRLFLGSMDAFAWNNNIGSFTVEVTHTIVPGDVFLDVEFYAGVTIDAPVGSTNRIEYVTDVEDNNWHTLTNIVLPHSPFLFIDTQSPGTVRRYYRAVME